MEYSALKLETLALHVLLRAGLAPVDVNPIAKKEMAAWMQLMGTYSLVKVEVEVLTIEGEKATEEQWEFGLTSRRNEIPEAQQECIIQLESCCVHDQKCWAVNRNGLCCLEFCLAGDLSFVDDSYDLPSPSHVLSQEAFELGRLRVSNFVRWRRPILGGMEKELVVSEERYTFTGCKEGLVCEKRVISLSVID